MDRLDKPPQHVTARAAELGIPPEGVVFAAAVDLSLDGGFREVWLVAGSDLLLILDGERRRVISVKSLGDVKADGFVGNGALIAKVDGEPEVLCRYTNACARKMHIAARVLGKLAAGDPVTDEDFRDDKHVQACPKCGRLFPDPQRQICPPCFDKRALSLRVFSFFKGYRLHAAAIICLMLAGSALNLFGPYMNGKILFDEVLTPGGRYEGRVVEVVLLMAALQLAAIGLNVMHARINAAMTARVIAGLKARVFEAMQRLSLGFFTSKQTGGLMVRVNSDANNLQYFFHDGFPFFVVNLMQIIGILSAMLALNWRLALLIFIPVPILIAIMRWAFPKLWTLYSRRHRKLRSMTAVVNDALTGVRVVKAFGREEQEIQRFGARSYDVYSVSVQTGYFSSALWPAMTLVMNAGGLIVWSVGGWDVLEDRITLGTLITFTLYLGMLYGPLEFMTHIVDWWTNCINSAQRIFELLDSVPDVLEKPDPVRLSPIRGDVELRNVTFGYEPNKPVLKDVSFTAKAGEVIGIVGKSGAGKSTIANLISRLYDVEKGAVLIDGVDVRDAAIGDLRRQIGMVLQDTYLFHGTIAENIAYAKPGATPEEIIRAAKAANAHDFIMKLPDGYETVIGGRGRDLSGGERQRISIARAILHDPRILILDEATASVDTETERLVQEALERLVQGRTTFSIAHRLSTLRNADRLVVIEDGKVVEMGTHEELDAKQGVYYRLRTKQEEALAIRGVAND